MNVSPDNGPFLHLIDVSKTIFLLVNPDLGMEALSSALGLRLALMEKGKEVTVFFPGELPDLPADLEGLDTVEEKIPAPALNIQLPLNGVALSKVGYFVKDDTVNLVLTPKEVALPTSGLRVSTEPLMANLLVLFGYPTLIDLERDYPDHILALRSLPMVNLDYHKNNERYAQANLVDEDAKSIAEIVFSRLGSWGFRPSYGSAECLLVGLGLKDQG